MSSQIILFGKLKDQQSCFGSDFSSVKSDESGACTKITCTAKTKGNWTKET